MYNGYDLVVYDTNILIDLFDKRKSRNRISKDERVELRTITRELLERNKVFVAPFNRFEYLYLMKNKIKNKLKIPPELDFGYIPQKLRKRVFLALKELYQNKLGENFLQTDDIVDLMTITYLIVFVKQNGTKVVYVTHDTVLNDREIYNYIYNETGGKLEVHDIDTFITLFKTSKR